LALLTIACSSDAPTAVEQPTPPTAPQRIATAIDSLNAAIATHHAQGGRIELLQLLQPDSYPPDSTIPPVVVIILREP
jgi:hypothetical protein